VQFEFFIARRQLKNNQHERNISGSLINVAVFGVALCVVVMIISIAILTGFKKEIKDKVVSFGSHIHIVNYDSNNSFETNPINKDTALEKKILALHNVDHIQVFGIKAGILKSETDIQGIVMKGIGSDFDQNFFNHFLVDGQPLKISDSVRTNKIIISKFLSDALQVKVGDEVVTYFVQNPPRVRKFEVSGIYKTDIEDIDKVYVYCDIAHIQRLNNWQPNEISGYEIKIGSFNKINTVNQQIKDIIGYDYLLSSKLMKTESIIDKYPQIFDWLNLQDMNVIIILIIMIILSVFSMSSGLLIMILDKTHVIGILKSLGAKNKSIQTIFLIHASKILLKGLLWGNLIALAMCYMQHKFHILKLDASSYYTDHVPIFINATDVLFLNFGIIIITLIVLIIPSYIISKLSPAETIKYR